MKVDATAVRARTNVSFCCFNHGIAARKPMTTMTTGENHSTHRPIFLRGWVVMRVFLCRRSDREGGRRDRRGWNRSAGDCTVNFPKRRSEEHTSALQSLISTSYALFCLTKNKTLHTPK